MGYKAAVQVLKQAEDLKAKISGKCDWLNNNEAWADQHKLQNLYHQVLVLDLEYALDKKVEQDLWNLGFKNHISSLQEIVRNKKNPQRSDSQALLTWALECASGFYITLLQELCNTFDIDLPFRRRSNVFGQSIQSMDSEDLPQNSSCLYICQYCLVHLGDISRYRNQRKQAESFYKQAILVSPSSGHPYNQLALLEASQGNKLSTVFYYIRSIAVKNPFLASATNLSSTLISAINKDSSLEKIPTKMTVNEFIQLFLCTHGYFHTVTELKQAQVAVKGLNSIMTALVATQAFTGEMLMKITIINLFALNHFSESLDNDKQKVKELAMELIAGSLCAFLVPIHTLKVDETLLDYYALPSVKIMLYFIKNKPEILRDQAFSDRLLIWPSLVKLVNNIQKYLKGFNYVKYAKYPLPEDKSLKGFLPLAKNFDGFDFNEEIDDIKIEKLLRLKRISDIAMWLTEIDVNGNKLIVKIECDGEMNLEPRCAQPDPTNELLEEMKSFTIESPSFVKNKERKAGILKPQGSLEKSREERETLSSNTTNNQIISNESSSSVVVNNNNNAKVVELVKLKRGKQNVALQSIFKKMEESNKQVKFVDEEIETEKNDQHLINASSITQTINTQNPSSFNLPLRTQSFNQNHPAFPLQPSSSSKTTDYLLPLRGPSGNFPYSNKPVDVVVAQQPPPPSLTQQANFMPTYQSNQNKTSSASSLMNNMNQKQQLPPSNFQQHKIPAPNTFGNNGAMPDAFPNNMMHFSIPHNFNNNWKSNNEINNSTSNSWWQQNAANQPLQQPQNYRNQNNYPTNFPMYSSNIMPAPPPPPPAAAPHPTHMRQQNNKTITTTGITAGVGGGGDLFNIQSWSNNYNAPPSPYNIIRDDGNNQPTNLVGVGANNKQNNNNMSIRQAMLKEANISSSSLPPIIHNTTTLPNDPNVGRFSNILQQENNFIMQQHQQNNSPAPGYSLFNTNSWTPNLAGQLINNKHHHHHHRHQQQQQQQQQTLDTTNNVLLTQPSLFNENAPKSLAQLLEHQQNQMNKGDS